MTENNIHMAGPLLAWYDQNRRILPWREDPTPYHVWLSEIMLQQTRVEAVRSYYERFLTVLPDIRALAEAPEDQYLKLWEGLGYYSRVRNLHKAAQVIVTEHEGKMPAEYNALCKLPGIGPYTAAAIASIAFGEPVPAIDGNLLRVFARLSFYEENILAPAASKAAWAFYEERIHRERPGEFNQALMDLGALICLPNRTPLCDQCPLQDACSAHALGRETEVPFRPAKKKRQIEKMTVLLIHYRDHILLHKRSASGLLAGLYEFPNTSGWLTREEALREVEALGLESVRIRKLPAARHIFSHKEWHMHGYQVFAGDWQAAEEEAGLAVRDLFLASTEEIETVWSIPSAFRAYTDIALGRD